MPIKPDKRLCPWQRQCQYKRLFENNGHRQGQRWFSLPYTDGCQDNHFRRIYNDKADSYPHHAGKFVNFRIFIEFFIHEVEKTLKFWVSGHICITNINNRDFHVYQDIFFCMNI